MRTSYQNNILVALLVAVGIALAGWFIGDGFIEARSGDRYVTVKGVSERDVMADMALWPIRYVAAGNNLNTVQQKIRQDQNRIQTFLEAHGIAEEAIELQNLEVTDRTAQSYQSGSYENRFILEQTLMVRSESVTKIEDASQDIGTLVEAGIILNSQYSGGGPTYLFNGLTELKPDMIAEATKNARQSAEQFASDSGSELDGIRSANQGVFVILARDKAPMLQEEKQIRKTVRVVSTIEYYLAE
ncbi:SIMPL domain-containing protein [Aliifodinibius salicampi]|uniref:SIMPL domain-containing protein n=1 Tax=Fodinibius salicampi TaxID=1920655 RepID=A0ABT3PWA7_9BACT|nr:SIMPL domain-containing protein [Fodinibius salicampi]MCW9712128.1 SIMPL domain-containing protein [Fodinibius salicampi]